MNKNVLKSTFKAASNVLLILALGLMVVAVYLENFYLSIGGLVLSAASIVITVLSADELKAKSILKELNIYFFLVAIIVNLSVILNEKVLFYVGLVLFILMILLYFIPMFFEEKEEKQGKKNNKKKK
jgi:Ca2+/Na+ antiporter